MTGMLDISVSARPSDIVMRLAGDCDITTAPQLAAALDDIPAGYRRLIIDLSGLQFMDAASVRVLLNTRNRLAAQGSQLIAATPQPIVSRVLELTGAYQALSTASGKRPEGYKNHPAG